MNLYEFVLRRVQIKEILSYIKYKLQIFNNYQLLNKVT